MKDETIPYRKIKYDERGNLIHYKDYNGFEYWQEYDENNNCIHYQCSNGVEFWQEFDENSNIIYHKKVKVLWEE